MEPHDSYPGVSLFPTYISAFLFCFRFRGYSVRFAIPVSTTNEEECNSTTFAPKLVLTNRGAPICPCWLVAQKKPGEVNKVLIKSTYFFLLLLPFQVPPFEVVGKHIFPTTKKWKEKRRRSNHQKKKEGEEQEGDENDEGRKSTQRNVTKRTSCFPKKSEIDQPNIRK